MTFGTILRCRIRRRIRAEFRRNLTCRSSAISRGGSRGGVWGGSHGEREARAFRKSGPGARPRGSGPMLKRFSQYNTYLSVIKFLEMLQIMRLISM
jgi:hypothetical protein